MSDHTVVGKRIIEVRPMTASEMEAEGWDRPPTVLVLDDGSRLYPSRDDEGNGPGTIFGAIGDDQFYVGGPSGE